ncbi:MAG: cytochrome P450 [Micromonosporaceae bacterium]
MTTTASRSGAPPTVPAGWWLGSVAELRRDMLGTFERARRDHGDVVRFQVGPAALKGEVYAVFHPDAVQQIMGGQWQAYRKDTRFYQEIRRALGDGLLTSQDEAWVRQKRFLQPLFTVKRVNGYADAMADEAARLAAEWRQRADQQGPGTNIDLYDEIMRLTLRVVLRILFGEDAERAHPVVRAAFPVVAKSIRGRAFSPIRTPLSWPTAANRRTQQAQDQLLDVCSEIIARRRGDGRRRDDFLGLLLAARDGDEALTDQEVLEQVAVFLLAGHDTTATALTMTLWLLSQHPEAQRRLRDEIARVLGDRTPAAEDMRELTYLTMALKEGMRLYPSAPVIGRRSTLDSEICGWDVPAGVDIATVPWVIHRHPDLWDAPERFDPERFTPEREKARHRYAWFPFGGGPRACIGQHFSMLESVIALASLTRGFHIESPARDVPVEMHVTLRPSGPVPAQLHPID